MPARFKKRSTRFRKFSKRRSSFKRRPSARRASSRRSRKSRPTHRKLSFQRISTFFPDVAISKLKGHHIWTNVACLDLSTALNVPMVGTANNTISVIMNGNPNNGSFYHYPGAVPTGEELNPVKTYITKYLTYRPMGMKLTVTVFSQDDGQENPMTNLATPFTLFGFPCAYVADSIDVANRWNGTTAANYNAGTVPQMKYGFRRISTGMGGKNLIKYTTYWDFAKILGWTKAQYLSSNQVICAPNEDSNTPAIPIVLVLALADYVNTIARDCTVDFKITQYGRWEGQQADYF